jgi:hypothetical protein
MSHEDRLVDYVDVAQRIREFREKYPEGSLQPLNLEQPFEICTIGDRTFIVYVAAAYRTPDDTRPGVGIAWEPFPGGTPYTRNSELQNAETAAWGRAIVAALAGDTKKIASRDEVTYRQAERRDEPKDPAPAHGIPRPASDAQKKYVKDLLAKREHHFELDDNDIAELTVEDAKSFIEELKALPVRS